MAKVRLDNLLVTRGLAESRAKAQALIMAGSVRVAGQPAAKAGMLIDEAALLEVTAALPYASRGGYKLAHALDQFGLDPTGLVALDAGASTGGFTDVLLQRGATRVYAVDVGYGILDYRLRADPRVVVLERINIRHLEALPDGALAACAVIDVSFISLKLVLPAVQRLLAPGAWTVALIKPQFEAGPEQVGKGGVVRDPKVHRAVLHQALAAAANLGMTPRGLARSPITGPAGNIEFLAWLQPTGEELAVETAIDAVL
jgi:23S rRNA (cytidine1920-2'-O)/16S rRNA (cytidine1409-2'-O)-methyltransferase